MHNASQTAQEISDSESDDTTFDGEWVSLDAAGGFVSSRRSPSLELDTDAFQRVSHISNRAKRKSLALKHAKASKNVNSVSDNAAQSSSNAPNKNSDDTTTHGIYHSSTATNSAHNNTATPSIFENVSSILTNVPDTCNSGGVSRRRRHYNFPQWVAQEKRNFEKVYHRRFKHFHGALSDSEDGDFEEDIAAMEVESLEPIQLTEEDLNVLPEHAIPQDTPESESRSEEIIVQPENTDRLMSSQVRSRFRTLISDGDSDSDVTADPEHAETDLVDELNVISLISGSDKSESGNDRISEIVDMTNDNVNVNVIEMTEMERSSRRRRYDFKKYVDTEKQAHESVYARRIAYFHGALSDSEDEDYGEIREPSEVVESQPDSDSDVPSESDYGNSIVIALSRRLTKPIPASKRSDETAQESPNWSDSFPELFELPQMREDFPREQAAEGRGGFDYMLAHTERSTKSVSSHASTTQRNRELRASNRQRSLPREAQPRITDFTATGSATLNRKPRFASRNSSISALSEENVPLPSSTVNAILRSEPPIKKAKKRTRLQGHMWSTSNFVTTVLERAPDAHTSRDGYSRAGRNGQPCGSHTGPSHTSHSQSSSRTSVSNTGRTLRRAPSASIPGKSSPGYGSEKIAVKVSRVSPAQRFNSELGSSTFIGSSLLRMIEFPEIWEYKDSSFGTPLYQANQAQVAKNIEQILTACLQGGEDSLLPGFYDYFLHGTAFLCDESQIVPPLLDKFVLQSWTKLAQRLVRHIMKQRYRVKSLCFLTAELVALAVLVISKRTLILRPNSRSGAKAQHLAVSTVFYLQQHISKQIDNVNTLPCGHVGAELAYVASEFGVLESLSVDYLEKGTAESNWHYLLVMTAVKPRGWEGWSIAKRFLADNMAEDEVHVAMEYSQLLISHWEWPGSVDVIAELYSLNCKDISGDPRGEKLWLPQYLARSQFDGNHTPVQNMALFLELLGLTLRKLQEDVTLCRRIRGRVTPLTRLSFKETSQISPAELSRVKYQYGILIVLLRTMPIKFRPPLSQFRDLVTLKDAHLGVRVMAVSTWSIVSQFVLSDVEAQGCRDWMKADILQTSPPDPLIEVSLKVCAPVVHKGVVPVSYLVQIALASSQPKIRNMAFDMLQRTTAETVYETLSGVPVYKHFESTDFDAYARLVLYNPDIFYSQVGEVTPAIIEIAARIVQLKRRELETPHPTLVKILTDVVLSSHMSEAGRKLLLASSLLISESINDLSQRRSVLRRLATMLSTPLQYQDVLAVVNSNLDGMNRASALRYSPVVVEARSVVFSKYPELRDDKFVDENIKSLESLNKNIERIVERGRRDGAGMFDESCTASYYFFAFKLQGMVFALNKSSWRVTGDEFCIELVSIHQTLDGSFHAVVNDMFTLFFLVAAAHEPTLGLMAVLPAIVRIVKQLVYTKPEANCLPFLSVVSEYLLDVFSRTLEPLELLYSLDLVAIYAMLASFTMNKSSDDSLKWMSEDFSQVVGCIRQRLSGEVPERVRSQAETRAGTTLQERGRLVQAIDMHSLFAEVSPKVEMAAAAWCEPATKQCQDTVKRALASLEDTVDEFIWSYCCSSPTVPAPSTPIPFNPV